MDRKTIFLTAALSVLIGVVTVPRVRADNLLVNGAFESPLEPDWQTSATSYNYTVDRGVGYDPDLDYEARLLEDTGSGWVRTSQTVWIPSTEVEISAALWFYTYATSSAWGAAALSIEYLDGAQAVLGETRIGQWTHLCTWADGPALHLIGMPAEMWFTYTLELTEELTHLPAVDPQSVAYVRVSLFTDVYDC